MESAEDNIDIASVPLQGLDEDKSVLSHSLLVGEDVEQHSNSHHQVGSLNTPRQNPPQYLMESHHSTQNFGDERGMMVSQRDHRWIEIRKYSDFIRRFAGTPDVAHIDITKENFYDLYNSALGLLKSIDGLDPDKAHVVASNHTNMPQLMGGIPSPYPKVAPTHPMVSPMIPPVGASPVFSPMHMGVPVPMPNPNMYYRGYYPGYSVPSPYGEIPPIVFDQSPQQRSRKSPAASNKRNLQCTSCAVTKTPEWRRGPSGDHTLCNACGLQYAKSLKKQKKDKEVKRAEAAQQQQNLQSLSPNLNQNMNQTMNQTMTHNLNQSINQNLSE